MSAKHPAGSDDQNWDEGEILDLLFVQDTTGSQGPYIVGARNSILEICHLLQASGKLRKDKGLRVGLLAYRDYPPEDQTYITKPYEFTHDLDIMKRNLGELTAEGGGDDPEALSAALECALNMKGWRTDATKVIVVVTDAPPHGIGERGDSFPNGAPDGVEAADPLGTARLMAENSFTLFILACEPTLSKYYSYATDFYKALAKITSGATYALTDPRLLSACIIGSALEGIELQALSRRYQEDIAQRIFVKKEPIDKVIEEVHSLMLGSQQKVTTVDAGRVYKDSPVAEHNCDVWITCQTIADARGKLKRVPGSRFTPAYNNSTITTSSAREFYKVKVTVKNTGSKIIVMKTFDSGEQKLSEKVIKCNHMYTLDFDINTPYNFVLECERTSKPFSRTFSAEVDLNVHEIFQGS
ncbi:hypothetical protein DFH11DRAFT_1181496 [Phellopilus nigrolimitatus]|nr:hypothetical protein DFH11DRAFT_1181496 [Phellopilus nigrolimitatus]